jgi:plasmid stability protein
MPNVLVRDLPDEVHRVLVRRAEGEGRSLQQYLTEALTRLASSPTLDEVLDRIATLRGGSVSLAEAVEALAEARAER